MPAIHGAAPTAPREGLIPILPGAANAAPARPQHVDPWKFWEDYYKSGRYRPSPKKYKDPDHQELKDLCETLRLLNVNRKHADVQAALSAYMIYRPKMIEPWMYEALAQSLKLNGGRPDEVRKYLGYAADMALKDDNPNNIVSAADMLMLNGNYERVGALLDKAYKLVPHQAPPMLMSLNLALKTKDPQRMSDAVEKVLGLGWPGLDERFRGQAHQGAESLARTLREDGRSAEASELLNRLTASEARDLFIRLTWLGDADLDLVVEEPEGVSTARYRTPRTVFGGSIIRNGYGKHPLEVYVCPRAFDGDYSVRIETIYSNDEKPASNVKLEVITHEGTAQEHKETHMIKLGGGKLTDPVVVKLKGGRRKETLPFLAPRVDIPDSVTKPKSASNKPPADTPNKPDAARPGSR
ncbi:MAG: hypothetical protein P4L84_26650 [Isosphaeraceae bacterium]|nr:hypothetical protein [Isosphaeraceae bacterium]